VNRAWKVEASIASVAFVVVVEPFAVGSVGVGTTLRYVLLRKLRSTLWAAVAYDRHYPMLQNHCGDSMLVGTSEI
jgi:DNA mismatch repair protein MutH